MNRANPADLRKALIAAQTYANAGLLFVPMPVASQEEWAAKMVEAAERLETIAQELEQAEAQPNNGR